MKNITIPQDILDKLQNISSLEIQWNVKNYSYVNAGDTLGIVNYTIQETKEGFFSTRKVSLDKQFQIISPNDGYLFIYDESNLDWKDDDTSYVEILYDMDFSDEDNEDIDTVKGPLAGIFNSIEELFSHYYDCKGSKVKTDPYTGLKYINWVNQRGINVGWQDFFSIDFHGDTLLFCFKSDKKVHIGDTISLLFDDEYIADFTITTNPENGIGYDVSSVLYQEDIYSLLHSALVSCRITYKNRAKHSITIEFKDTWWNHPFKNEAIHAYVKNHIDTIQKLIPDYQLPRRAIGQTPIGYEFYGCYVYLMKDTTNGYYKIGISNTPEYREKTLQSEKPTIELLASKKYPTRKIAEAIESALHTAYSQQRLRGEWFKLDDVDVAAIIETLR